MVPYDIPIAAHDMILRFMGMNFSAIMDGSATIPSSLGEDTKPVFQEGNKGADAKLPSGETPEQDKAKWEGTHALYCEYLSAHLWRLLSSVLQCWVGSPCSCPYFPCDRRLPVVPNTTQPSAITAYGRRARRGADTS
jgi:hypothetical protein